MEGAFVAPGIEGIGPGPEVSGCEGMGGRGSGPDGAGAEGIGAGVADGIGGKLAGGDCDGMGPKKGGIEGIKPLGSACDSIGAEGMGASPGAEGIKPTPPSTLGA